MKINNTEEKICTKCGVLKEFKEFNKRKSSKDGLEYNCKSCAKERKKEYRQANKDKIYEYNKKYCQDNKENVYEYMKKYRQANKNKLDELHKKYYKNNKEKIIEYQKEYREANKDKAFEYMKEYLKNNKEKIYKQKKEYYKTPKGKEVFYKAKLKRRSYKHKVDFTPFERKKLLNRDSWKCQLCGIKVHDTNVNNETKAHIDHIIPISKGGNSDPSNLQILCRTCNLSKSNKLEVANE